MKKFPKVKYPGDPETDGIQNGEVVVTEKLDGANFRFTVEDGELIVGTRNHEYTADDENLPKAFYHAVEYLEQELTEDDKTFIEGGGDAPNITFFGEALHYHSLDYDGIDWHNPSKGSPHVPLESETPNVVLFDAYNENGWAPWDTFTSAAETIGFETTEVIDRGDFDEVDTEIPEESFLGGQPEGIVVRRTDGSVRAKKVADDFKEQNAQSFDDPSKAQSQAGSFVAAYITKPRIEKTAQKLIDEGEYDHLQMEMMEQLPRKVIEDAFCENGWTLITNDMEYEWNDDFKSEVRSKASSKCASILKQMMQEF
jgi:hypothetical protein